MKLQKIYLHKSYLSCGDIINIEFVEKKPNVYQAKISNSALDSVDSKVVYAFSFNETINNKVINIDYSLEYEDKYFISVIDAIFAIFTGVDSIVISNNEVLEVDANSGTEKLTYHTSGIWTLGSRIYRDTFYQQNTLWLDKSIPCQYPVTYALTDTYYHPIRPFVQQQTVYQRYIPWLKATLSFKVFDLAKDLPLFHQWMNDEEIDKAWGEAGSIDEHKQYINDRLTTESQTLPLISYLDDKPFGYFEVYWAKEDKIANYYQAEDFDRGWHVLIGDKSCRGKDFVSAWMPSISHYIFLDDDRTHNIVIEPRIDNNRMKKSLRTSGYSYIKNIDFPHKTAMLTMLNREHFFKACLLLPSDDEHND